MDCANLLSFTLKKKLTISIILQISGNAPFYFSNLVTFCIVFSSYQVLTGLRSFFHDICKFFQNSMIFPGFPGVLSFIQVFQVEWEP